MADASERSGEEVRLRGESVSVAKLYMPVKIRIGQKMEEKDAKGPGCQSKEAHLSSPSTLLYGCFAATAGIGARLNEPTSKLFGVADMSSPHWRNASGDRRV
jgi:hypothetical protein